MPSRNLKSGISNLKSPGSVSLHFNVNRLTLPGLSHAEAARTVDAMQKALRRLANKSPRKNWQRLAAIDRLDGGVIEPGARPEQIGEHLAAQIYRRLSA